ncbi:unnamed protein product [Pleuronectes platessa]|uniref:Protein DP71L n=1 Tax=Pleuronectes platessa TaxID=8262 RepID=A0A9N7UKN8_PLEPL|nr:unnamed protein product [Pleuronectes platessa]
MEVEDDVTLINLLTNMTDGCISSGQGVTPAALNSQTSSGISLLSDLSSAEDWIETNRLCPQQNGTKPPIAETACIFVQSQDNDEASESEDYWQSNGPRKCLCKSVKNLCVWEDPISDHEEEDDESLCLMNLLSGTSDPNDPFIFQAPLEIQRPGKASPRVSSPSECSKKWEGLDYALPEASAPTSTSTCSSSPAQSGVPCKKVQFSDHVEELNLSSENDGRASWQEAFSFQGPDKAPPCVPSTSECRTKDERLDNAPSEASAPTPSTLSSSFRTQSGAPTKTVQFSDHVEEFTLSGEEDRHGPWQQAAIDRFRFQWRCQEVEAMISYCLEPKHRSLVYEYLYASDTPPTHCVTGENTEKK